ncbi:MAG: DUF2141 domain-containing protein [Leptospiraceae bacterium]|nr:DUF2141 domain-containing protein [Leptospiraceae bacterium]MCP5493227.1 DUF2141 domain-containing protein [Leptospiraceae bacterium]
MKTKLLFIYFTIGFLGFNFLYAQEGSKSCELEVKVSGLKNQKGSVMLGIYNKNHKGFPDDKYIFKNVDSKISIPEPSILISKIPCGKYAAAIFHDENGNKKLDKNLIGIPKEGYGFSNNPKSNFGPPNYEKAEFQLDSGKKTITIKMVYLME